MNPGVDGVGPRYFATMGIPLVAGREFTERDVQGSPRVAIVNETLARYFFGGGNAVGRRFGIGGGSPTDIEIVGVVRDVRAGQLRDEPLRFVYLPYRQNPDVTQLTVLLRIAPGSTTTVAAVRQAAQRIDPNIPIFDLKTMSAQVDESLFVERMVAALSVAFGVLATMLAAIGLYGVLTYAVARRTREIGIRMALGAERGRVLWLVLKEVAVMGLAGVGAGLLAAIYASRQIQAQLFGLSPTDPATLAAAAGLLMGIAIVAGLVPARRATTIDPLIALRSE
jgi:predicted permease